MKSRLAFCGLFLGFVALGVSAQQTLDLGFRPEVTDPVHAAGEGPLILIDSGHRNFHTREGSYAPFAALLEADGYVVETHDGPFTTESLSRAKTLVIASAIHQENERRWELPVLSAFSDEEIDTVERFVKGGGGLLIIVDHMPFPGAAAGLAARFGIDLPNGFAFVTDGRSATLPGPAIFRRSDGGVVDHPITMGRNPAETVNQVASFSGSAFIARGDVQPLIRFGDRMLMLYPEIAWKFDGETRRELTDGWCQGAALEYGAGRVVVFAEAAMFTSQLDENGIATGMTSKVAIDNQKLALNIIRWLSFDLGSGSRPGLDAPGDTTKTPTQAHRP